MFTRRIERRTSCMILFDFLHIFKNEAFWNDFIERQTFETNCFLVCASIVLKRFFWNEGYVQSTSGGHIFHDILWPLVEATSGGHIINNNTNNRWTIRRCQIPNLPSTAPRFASDLRRREAPGLRYGERKSRDVDGSEFCVFGNKMFLQTAAKTILHIFFDFSSLKTQ